MTRCAEHKLNTMMFRWTIKFRKIENIQSTLSLHSYRSEIQNLSSMDIIKIICEKKLVPNPFFWYRVATFSIFSWGI